MSRDSSLLPLSGNVVVRESSPLSDLELGISSYGGLRSVIKQEHDQFLFTASQFQDLCHQVVIFRYILSGLPVPIHLVIPVWKSVASSLGSAKTGIFRHFPSLARVFGDFDCRSVMDPEPGRCRRTDGKKWRCYKDVVPHQKYCERHMHRGSQRSRKRVETSDDAHKSNTSAINSSNYAPSMFSSSTASSDSRITIAVSTSLDLTVPCSNSSKSKPGTFKDSSSSYTVNGKWENKGKSIVGDKSGSGSGMNNFNHIVSSKMDGSNLRNKMYSDASFAPGFGLSPKSVLQHDKAIVCTRLNLDCKALEETEPLRCRRSDGRKWRCRREVVPDKKYCEAHLCRGSKKATLESKPVMAAPPVNFLPRHDMHSSRMTPSEAEKKINLNTDLSISMAASTPKAPYGYSSSFSSSDATTLTDENASISHNLTLSP